MMMEDIPTPMGTKLLALLFRSLRSYQNACIEVQVVRVLLVLER